MAEITAKLIESEGSHFQKYITLPIDEVYIPKRASKGNNPTRNALDMGNVNSQAESYRNSGQDLSLPLPVIEKLARPIYEDGKVYYYQLVCGFHRCAGWKMAGATEVYFSIYKFDDGYCRHKFQLKENNHAPQKATSIEDLANALAYAVVNLGLENTEESMREFLKDMNKIHGNTKNSAIAKALRNTDGYQDYMLYTPDDVKSFADNGGFAFGGNLDKSRNKRGWFVKEGYEHEYVMNASKKLKDTKTPSYFVCHTKSPTKSKSLCQKRLDMMDTFQHLESSLDLVFEYKQKHGKYPWEILGFLPQDNSTQENSLIELKQ